MSTQKAGESPTPVTIVGFAPTWKDTPWHDPSEKWGLNALHKVAGDKPWSRWYQLHSIERHHRDDRAEHLGWLRDSGMPVFMFEHHISELRSGELPNAQPYPLRQVLSEFGGYFNNSISWMIAHALLEGRPHISIFGVDMAADTEYGHQRPSCEYMIGVARGRGVSVYVPPTADLLKTPYLYGAEEGGAFRERIQARLKDLHEQRQQLETQIGQLQAQHHQLLGAIQDAQYWLQSWTIPPEPTVPPESVDQEKAS